MMEAENNNSTLTELIELFTYNHSEYKKYTYDEANTRTDFIDKFFTYIGWDVANNNGYSEMYRDVVREDKIRIDGKQKAPDYSFRIGGNRKFFVEAKKPSVNIKEDTESAFQIRRYGYTAKLPLSVLTNFESFAIYDTRIKPNKNDKASVARVFFCDYTEYNEKISFIKEILSKESVLKGSFDKYVDDNKKKHGTSEVDKELLGLIEEWRLDLAKAIATKNPEIDIYNINLAVQKIIDRIIFLRIAEDKEVEEYGQLQNLVKFGSVYASLTSVFNRANIKYNSGLFAQESWLSSLIIDDKVLSGIIKTLYYPECPYEFSVLPVEILGDIYEQFLGKVIRFKNIKGGHTAVIEEKPDVRKAGGVYYTPNYIVKYIISNTVAKAIEEKKPENISDFTICDPSCGSGSFLVSAYQYLLNYHLGFYTKDEKTINSSKKSNKIFESGSGTHKLTIEEKQRILLNNIYGVDIDPQAVEVTKLSLYLKLMEDEGRESQGSLFKHSDLKMLPTLDANIQCGNSLVDDAYYHSKDLSLFGLDDLRKVNVMSWKTAFPNIFKRGGFDCVIGNPPYLYSAAKDDKKYFEEQYKLSEYQTDFYSYFIEKSIEILRDGGVFSYITPDSWLNSKNFSKLRSYLLQNVCITSISTFDYLVFEKASIENAIFVLEKSKSDKIIDVIQFTSPSAFLKTNSLDPTKCVAAGMINIRSNEQIDKILEKIERGGVHLQSIAKTNRGVHAYRTDGYGKSKFQHGPQTKKDKDEKVYHASTKVDETFLPEVKGKQVFRYRIKPTGSYLSYGDWLAEPRTPEFFYSPKILLRKILGDRLFGAFTEEPLAIDQSLYICIGGNSTQLKSCLAVLMSHIGAWYLKNKYSIFDTLYPWYTKDQLSKFPVVIDDLLAKFVNDIENANAELDKATSPTDKNFYSQKIKLIENQIDNRVNEIYGITKDEYAIIVSH